MSARSRYLAAISPRSGEGESPSPSPSAAVSPTYNKSIGGGGGGSGSQTASLKSPTDIRGRGRSPVASTVGGGYTTSSGGGASGGGYGGGSAAAPPPPPPPPPGPPPKRGKVKHSQQQQPQAKQPTRQPADPEQQQSNAPADTTPAKAGTQWSPHNEIQGGSVAKFQQMLWGGGSPKESPRKRTGNVASVYTQNLPGHPTPSGGASPLPGSSPLQGANSLPPATPPRHTGSPSTFRASPLNTGSGVANSSPKYKRNAPPPLNKEETPTLQLHQADATKSTPAGVYVPGASGSYVPAASRTPPRSRALPSPNRIAPRIHGGGGSGGRESPLRTRVGHKLNLRPLDTSFGQNNDASGGGGAANDAGDWGNEGGVASSGRNARSGRYTPSTDYVPKPTGSGVYVPSPTTPSGHRSPSPPAANVPRREFHRQHSDEGIATLTAFKRPHAKVGIVFTRRSADHPEIAVISRVLPESIFARHRLSSPKDGDGATLEGAEVIAVNGTPVRDPRHAAELVARAAEEVRLTVKRGGMEEEKEEEKEEAEAVDAIDDAPEAPRDPHALPHPQSAGAESALSARTEASEALSARTEEGSDGPAAQERAVAHVNPSVAPSSTSRSTTVTAATSATAPKSAEIAERRRKVAQAMLLSEELVEDPVMGGIPESTSVEGMDPIQSARSGEGEEVVFDARGRSPVHGGASTISAAASGVSAAAKSGVSAAASGVSSASAADRRRQAALEMYHSEAMVEDNVDDVRLGTIDAVSPSAGVEMVVDSSMGGAMRAKPLSEVGRVTSFNSNAARTDVTTSTVATARMGGSSPRKRPGMPAFGSTPTDEMDEMEGSVADAASAAAASALLARTAMPDSPGGKPLESPAAQRRRDRALQRLAGAAPSPRGVDPVGVSSPKDSEGRKIPTPRASPSNATSAPPSTTASPASPPSNAAPAPSLSRSQTDEESAAAGSAAISQASSGLSGETPKGSRNRFGRKKSGKAETPKQGSGKKKASIFGVARLIRKASSKKSRSSKKGVPLNDSHLFEDDAESEAVPAKTSAETSGPNPEEETAKEAPQSQPPPLMDSAPVDTTMTTVDPFNVTKDSDADWGDADFFKADPFSSSPFDGAAAGNDGFGFSSSKDADPFASFDNTHGDSWGEPQMLAPVDFTPRKANKDTSFSSANFRQDNSDLVSYDGTEMSEVTNPTFASHGVHATSKPDPDAGDEEKRKSVPAGSSTQEPSESDGEGSKNTEVSTGVGTAASSGKENRFGRKLPPSYAKKSSSNKQVVGDPPLAIGAMESSEDERDDREDPAVQPMVAKSRILSKYANRRRPSSRNSSSLGTIHGTPERNERQGTRSLGSAKKLDPAKKDTPTSAESTPTRKGGAIQKSKGQSNAIVAQQQRQASTNSTITSSRAARRGRMSPVRVGTSSTAGNVSPSKSVMSGDSRGAANSKYGTRKKKASPSVVDNPNYYSMESRLVQIKDPIQRAGVRLLWAAAIPIQTQARRFLARQVAIKRMCAVLTIQAFVRRWLAERDLEIAVWSAIQIQAAFRGWFARDSLEDNHYCATQIQRVVRGYLATMHVFEDLYSITIVQSVVRMHLSINDAVDRLSSIIAIQSWWRGIKAREHIEEMDYSAVAIQANWRRYLAQMSYQFDIIDIIIVQSVVRRWKTCRHLAAVRLQCFARVMFAKTRFMEKDAIHTLVVRHTSATKIQAQWRSYVAQMTLLHYIAATRIQSCWRRYSAQEDYLLQTSAMKIQSCWRSYTAQVHMLVSIVNVIVIQSLWRRRAVTKLYGPLLHRIKLAKERKRSHAATTIQSAWRGFVVYSTWLIKRYENKAAMTIQAHWRGYSQATTYSVVYLQVVKIQALIRGHQERAWQAFQEECATIIQATTRRFLVKKECHNECMVSILIAAAANSLRVRNAATRLQRWWSEETWVRKEKHAALVIERFFIYVKKEVEKEVKALKKKKKERRRRRKIKQSDDYILERAWLGVADDVAPAMPAAVPPRTVGTGRKASNKHDHHRTPEEDSQSDVSGLTDLDFGGRNARSRLKKSQKQFEEDASLEGAFRESEAQLVANKRRGGGDHSRRHGQPSTSHRGQGYHRRYDR